MKSYAEDIDSPEIRFLHGDEWDEYTAEVKMRCYDAREIFAEKCRAALTRRSYKLRDLLDVYFMQEGLGYSVEGLKNDIIRKTNFMLDLYTRYHENFMFTRFPRKGLLASDEMKLLLADPPRSLGDEIVRIQLELEELKEDLVSRSRKRK
ncbi:MAG: hypothetical protein A3K67_05635 [Euryarchaeota archaeon RBG_16_62_10]|nr:MAG: hypothetical protein A3K67_05635 [Euryarchaeota archaeon RBG_16_62_10]